MSTSTPISGDAAGVATAFERIRTALRLAGQEGRALKDLDLSHPALAEVAGDMQRLQENFETLKRVTRGSTAAALRGTGADDWLSWYAGLEQAFPDGNERLRHAGAVGRHLLQGSGFAPPSESSAPDGGLPYTMPLGPTPEGAEEGAQPNDTTRRIQDAERNGTGVTPTAKPDSVAMLRNLPGGSALGEKPTPYEAPGSVSPGDAANNPNVPRRTDAATTGSDWHEESLLALHGAVGINAPEIKATTVDGNRSAGPRRSVADMGSSGLQDALRGRMLAPSAQPPLLRIHPSTLAEGSPALVKAWDAWLSQGFPLKEPTLEQFGLEWRLNHSMLDGPGPTPNKLLDNFIRTMEFVESSNGNIMMPGRITMGKKKGQLPSTALGWHQFLKGTWAGHWEKGRFYPGLIQKHARNRLAGMTEEQKLRLRLNRDFSGEMAKWYLLDDLIPALRKGENPITLTDLSMYSAWHFGGSAGAKLMRAQDDVPMSVLFPPDKNGNKNQVLAANPSYSEKTVGHVKRKFEEKLAKGRVMAEISSPQHSSLTNYNPSKYRDPIKYDLPWVRMFSTDPANPPPLPSPPIDTDPTLLKAPKADGKQKTPKSGKRKPATTKAPILTPQGGGSTSLIPPTDRPASGTPLPEGGQSAPAPQNTGVSFQIAPLRVVHEAPDGTVHSVEHLPVTPVGPAQPWGMP